MKAVMYGAGNIGRGFIGALRSQAGYHVSFIDVAEPVIRALQENGRYPVRYVSTGGHEDVWVENVTAVDGRNPDAVAQAIAECDIMATAVGARVLEIIVPHIVRGLRRRWESGRAPLNILICENLMDAADVLRGMIIRLLTEQEAAIFSETVGLVETSIGRMVPVQTEAMKDGEPLRVCVERYGFLPVDRDAFRSPVPAIPNLYPASPFDFFVRRKLDLHNMAHAVCAYLGGYAGKAYIWEAIEDPDVFIIVQNAMLESAAALAKQYDVPLSGLLTHADDLLCRFRNRALMDTCARVGGDPVRKLGANDRLIGTMQMIAGSGGIPVWTPIGAAGALYRYLQESGVEQTDENALSALASLAGLTAEHPHTEPVLAMYRLFRRGESPAAMRRAALERKEAFAGNIL